jgi:hypothetical protein
MPWVGTVTVVGLVVLAVLIWLFVRTRSQDMLTELMAKRKPSSKLVSRADYVEGMAHIPVALSLTNDSFYYENPDLQASFELKHIDEIEYDNELATGKSLEQGCRSLRLRSHGTAFEFILDPAQSKVWESMLPPRRAGQGAARAS